MRDLNAALETVTAVAPRAARAHHPQHRADELDSKEPARRKSGGTGRWQGVGGIWNRTRAHLCGLVRGFSWNDGAASSPSSCDGSKQHCSLRLTAAVSEHYRAQAGAHPRPGLWGGKAGLARTRDKSFCIGTHSACCALCSGPFEAETFWRELQEIIPRSGGKEEDEAKK